MNDSRPDARLRARDAGLARLRRATRVSIFGATALAGAFAGVAAHSSPGHKAAAATHTAGRVKTTTRQHVTTRRQTPQARAQTRTTAPTPAPAPVPVTTSAPPVAVTGTS